jgi:hypothetical protein
MAEQLSFQFTDPVKLLSEEEKLAEKRAKARAYTQKYRDANRERVRAMAREARVRDLERRRALERAEAARKRAREREDTDPDVIAGRRSKARERANRYRAADTEKARKAERIREARRKDKKEIKRRETAAKPDSRIKNAARMRDYRAAKPDIVNAIARRAWQKKKDSLSLQERLSKVLRSRLALAIRSNAKNGSPARDLGCSINAFKIYIAELFQPGMSWLNWGRRKGQWSLDHIIPLATFDLSDRAEFLVAVHYSSYQPLWHVDNIRKGKRRDYAGVIPLIACTDAAQFEPEMELATDGDTNICNDFVPSDGD